MVRDFGMQYPEQYQGIVLARSNENPFEVDKMYFAPSQRVEFEAYTQNMKLPCGRQVQKTQWLDEPVNRKGLELAVLNLIQEDIVLLDEN